MKNKIICILMILLLFGTLPIQINAQTGNDLDIGEDIVINVDKYEPTVVNTVDIEKGDYPVYAVLSAIKTNPTIDIPRIRSVTTNIEGRNEFVRSVNYIKPKNEDFTLDNMGYLVVKLKQEKQEDKVPDKIDVNISATIYYDVTHGFGVNEEDKVLGLDDGLSEGNAFWGKRGYIQLDDIKNGAARFVIYDNNKRKVAVTNYLLPKETSDEIYLAQGFVEGSRDLSVRERMKVYVDSIRTSRDRVRINMLINGEFKSVVLVEGQQIYDGSDWRVDRIIDGDNKQVVLKNDAIGETKTLHKKLRSVSLGSVKCSDFSSNKEACETLYSNQCEWKNNQCVEQKKTDTDITTLTTNSEEVKQAGIAFNRIWNAIGDLKTDEDRLSVTPPYNLQNYDRLGRVFIDLMKEYPSTVYYRESLTILKEGKGDVVGVIPFYWNKYRNEVDPDKKQEYKDIYEGLINELNSVIDANLNEIDISEKSIVDKTSSEYLQLAIDYYKTVVANYNDIGMDTENYYAFNAQRKIAEIYEFYLSDPEKAAEAYKVLLYNFPNRVVGQEDIIQAKINNFADAVRYDINYEEIYEDNNLVRLSLSDIERSNKKSEVTMLVDGVEQNFKIGDSIRNTDYFVSDIFPETNKATLRRRSLIANVNDDYANILKDKDTAIPLRDDSKNKDKSTVNLRLVSIDAKEDAFIKIIPGTERAYTKTNFYLHILVEPRFWDLTPEAIEKQINAVDGAIEALNRYIGYTDKLYSWFNTGCWSISAILLAKNIFTSGARIEARQQVIGKWEDFCKKDENGNYYSVQNCFDENSDEIERELDVAGSVVNKYKDYKLYDKDLKIKEEITKELSDSSSYKRNGQFSDAQISQIQNSYMRDYYETLPSVNLKKQVTAKVDSINPENIDAYFNSFDEAEAKILKQRYATEIDAINNKEDLVKGADALAKIKSDEAKRLSGNYFEETFSEAVMNQTANIFGEGKGTKILKEIKNSYIPVSAKDIDGNDIIFDSDIAPIGNGTYLAYYPKNSIGVPQGYELYKDSTLSGEVTKVQQGTKYYYKGVDNSIKTVVLSDEAKVTEKYTPMIALEESGQYKDKIKYISVDTYTYIEVKERDSTGKIKKIAIYQRSDANGKFGEGGRQIASEFDVAECDDKLKELQSKTDLNGNLILQDTISKDVCKDLSNGDKGNNAANGNVAGYLVDKALHSTEGLACYKIMDPSDCKLMFATCDPVMCPASRFNLGGKWNVGNVIQTGVVGSVFLGLPLFDPPEVFPVCVTGVNAGLKNYRAIMQGYKQCLERKRDTGESSGSCSYVRNIGVCETIWRNAAALSNIGINSIGSFIGDKTIDAGSGQEYSSFQYNMKRTSDFANYFTSQYAQGALGAYRGAGYEEIGTEVCKLAIFGRLPWEGSIIDQLSKPVSPPQFTAFVEEVPYSDITGEDLSTYRVWWNIYAGEEREISYRVYLRNDRGNEAKVTYNQRLGIGEVADFDDSILAPAGYNEVCVYISGYGEQCGFGKVTTDWAINYVNDKYVKSQLTTNITSEAECMPEEGVFVKDVADAVTSEGASGISASVLRSGLSILNTGITETGIVRTCSAYNPGAGTSTDAKNSWINVGECGKDSQGRDLGSCWMRQDSIDLLKDIDATESIRSQLLQNIKSDNEIEIILKAADDNLKSATTKLDELKRISQSSTPENKGDFDAKIKEIEGYYNNANTKYQEAIGSTLTDKLAVRGYYGEGEVNFGIADMKIFGETFVKSLDNKQKKEEKKTEVKTETTTTETSATTGAVCYNKINDNTWSCSLGRDQSIDLYDNGNYYYLGIKYTGKGAFWPFNDNYYSEIKYKGEVQDCRKNDIRSSLELSDDGKFHECDYFNDLSIKFVREISDDEIQVEIKYGKELETTTKTNTMVIGIDPGHGGSDPGAVYNGVSEKDINLAVANKLKKELENIGYRVVMTRDSDVTIGTIDNGQGKRADDMNSKNPDILISLHTNSVENPDNGCPSGTETYLFCLDDQNKLDNGLVDTTGVFVQGSENKCVVKNPYTFDYSLELAKCIQPAVAGSLNIDDKGIKGMDGTLLQKSNMPAILVEMGFICNREDVDKLTDVNLQDKLVKNIAEKISNCYFESMPSDTSLYDTLGWIGMFNVDDQTVDGDINGISPGRSITYKFGDMEVRVTLVQVIDNYGLDNKPLFEISMKNKVGDQYYDIDCKELGGKNAELTEGSPQASCDIEKNDPNNGLYHDEFLLTLRNVDEQKKEFDVVIKPLFNYETFSTSGNDVSNTQSTEDATSMPLSTIKV